MRIIIGNDKGGVGKTMAADFLVGAYDAAGRDIKVGEIDREQKLSAMLTAARRAVDLRLTPPDTEALVNSSELINFFTPALGFLLENEVALLDCGANLSSMLLQTAEMVDAKSDIDPKTLTIMACTTTDGQSMAGAAHMLTTAAKVFPGARLAVIANNKDGNVDESFFEDKADFVIRIGRSQTRIGTELVTRKLLRVSVAATIDGTKAKALFPDLDHFGAKALVGQYRRWYDDVIKQINVFCDLEQPKAAAAE